MKVKVNDKYLIRESYENREYYVLALYVYNNDQNRTPRILLDDLYESLVPLDLCEIIDGRIPDDWKICTKFRETDGCVMFTFKEVDDIYFFEEVYEGYPSRPESDDVKLKNIFKRIKKFHYNLEVQDFFEKYRINFSNEEILLMENYYKSQPNNIQWEKDKEELSFISFNVI